MRFPVFPRRATRGRVLAGTVAAVLGVVMVTWCGTGSREELGPRVFGVAVEGTPAGLSQLGEIRDLVGKAPEEVTWYVSWSLHSDFPAAGAARTAASGATPSLTWEPWDPAAGTEQPAYALDRITAGDHDAYIARWAEQVRSYGDPVVIRFAHEMNADWYPWSEQVNGNGPGEYVAAWRHVVDIFRARQVWNVTWSWSPNVPYAGGTDLAELYPGDAYVDRVALDGYNWGTAQPGSGWQPFGDVFGPGIAQLGELSSRPVFIGETGSSEAGGDKAAWVSDMFHYLEAHPEVRGITWFNLNKEADWRIQSSEDAATAFRAGLADF